MLLLEHKTALAGAVIDALYSEMPGLLDKYGERGRHKCFQDVCYNVEHLAPAVELGEAGLFASYAQWLNRVLTSRNVPTDEVVRSLELLEAAVGERFAAEHSAVVAPIVRAGVAALHAEQA